MAYGDREYNKFLDNWELDEKTKREIWEIEHEKLDFLQAYYDDDYGSGDCAQDDYNGWNGDVEDDW